MAPHGYKILVAGGFGVGKTTLVGTVSEIAPLRTEALMTSASEGIDDLDLIAGKYKTTVAMDFGRITFDGRIILFLFGTPGQDRFWFMWDDLRVGAIGALILADTRRLQDSFPAVDFFEDRGMPFLIAVNEFDGAERYNPDEVRAALDLDAGVPVVCCDARDRISATEALIALVEHAIALKKTPTASALGAHP